MMTPLIIILVVIVLVVAWFIGTYNSFIRRTNQVNEAWADIDVQLKRRYDLIPNLIETVKGYASHESKTLEAVIAARNSAMNSTHSVNNVNQTASAENALSGTLKSLFALSESYPDLKANTNFLELQRELSDTENKIQASRRFYNSNVRDFNTATQLFPSSLLANIFNFKARDLFTLDEAPAERENVQVKF